MEMADFQIWGLKNLPHTSHTSVIPDDTVKRRSRAASLAFDIVPRLVDDGLGVNSARTAHETIAEKS